MLLIHTVKRKAYNHTGTLQNTHTNKPTDRQPLLFLPIKNFTPQLLHCACHTEKLKDYTKPRLLTHTHKDLKARLHEWELRPFSVAA